MRGMTSPQPSAGGLSRSRRWAFGLVLAAIVWGGAEVAAFLVLSLFDRSLALPGRLRAERRRAAAEALGHTGQDRDPRRERPAWELQRVLHPFAGFVEDPARANWYPISPEGYPLVRGQAGQKPAGRFTVAIFGGSVAQHLCLGAARVLRQELAPLPQVAGRRIWIDCYALGGYKQPQQTMALAYALARGEQIDLVVNLDGFNEVALPVAENLPARVNPFYPRSWNVIAATAFDRDLLRRAGEVAYLEERRARRADLLESLPFRYSALAHVAWRAADRSALRRISEIEREPARSRSRRTLQRNGPPYPRRPQAETLRELAELWGRSSRLMDALCRSRGIPYFHFLQPNQYVEGSKPMGEAERRIAVPERSFYGPAARRGYPYLIEAGRRLKAEGEAYFDLTPIFAGVEKPLYADECCHLNPEGMQRLARAIAARISASPPGRELGR